jgi:mannose-6-phosphate isomerase-like protein (cupin superfamily)
MTTSTTPTTATIAVTTEAAAPRFDLPGVEFTAGAAPSRGSDQLCVWSISVEAGHVSDQPHTLDRDEVFTVISGTVCLQHGAGPLQAGDTAVVPAGVPIQVANPGTEPARVVVAIQAGFTASAADGTAIGTPPWAR